jgi:SAM-dependent methyltransferase
MNSVPDDPPSTDPKRGEREYFARIGAAGIKHSVGKPFSDENCAVMLANLDAIFHLLEPPPLRVVEFGCGVGWLALFLARRGYQVTGVDISPEAVAAAKQQCDAQQITGANFVVADYEDFSASEKFDCALFYDSLHHAEDERAALACAYHALKDDGMLITFEPGSGHSETASARHAVREFGVHEKDMPPRQIVRLGREVGFRRHLLLPRPHDVVRTLFRPRYGEVKNQGELRWCHLLGKLRLFRLLFHQRDEPIVLLWK